MKFKIANLILALVYAPWSLYLSYLVLTYIGATELMWFLFWVSVPMAFLFGVLSRLAEWED